MSDLPSYRAYLRQSDIPPLTPLCDITITVPIPLIPIINAHLHWLTRRWLWNGTTEKKDAVVDAIDLIMRQLADNECGAPPTVPPPAESGGGCNEYLPDSQFIEYQPESPVTLESVLDPINEHYWITGEKLPGVLDLLPGILPTDVYTFAVPTIGLLDKGFPRFKVRFNGAGVVQLNLIKSPFGGQALITVDGDPLTAQFVDMETLDLDDLQSYLQILAAVGKSFTGGLFPLQIIEIPIEKSGEHYIDVTMLPNVSLEPLPTLKFGGGLRSVVFCGQTIKAKCGDGQNLVDDDCGCDDDCEECGCDDDCEEC